MNYAFVEFSDKHTADQAIQAMNGRKIFDFEIKANWTQQSQPTSIAKEDTTNHFHIFVGDIAPEINDEGLIQAFSVFNSMSQVYEFQLEAKLRAK